MVGSILASFAVAAALTVPSCSGFVTPAGGIRAQQFYAVSKVRLTLVFRGLGTCVGLQSREVYFAVDSSSTAVHMLLMLSLFWGAARELRTITSRLLARMKCPRTARSASGLITRSRRNHAHCRNLLPRGYSSFLVSGPETLSATELLVSPTGLGSLAEETARDKKTKRFSPRACSPV